MSKLANAAIVWTYRLNTNQSNVVTLMVYKMPRRLFHRIGWQLIIIHLALMLPMHAKDEFLPHKF